MGIRNWMGRDPQGDNNKEHSLPNWLRLSTYPDFIIGGKVNPYIKRWYLLPRLDLWIRAVLVATLLWLHHPWAPLLLCGLYLHRIIRSDDDRALHDHPVANISIVLWGSYLEVVPDWEYMDEGERVTPDSPVDIKQRHAGHIIFRRAKDPHRLLVQGEGAWTLWVIGPPLRQWGFLCGRGWVYWKEFVGADAGTIGRGCD